MNSLWRTLCGLLVSLFLLSWGWADESGQTSRYWVTVHEQFVDGADFQRQIDSLKDGWNERSLERRRKNDCGVSRFDLAIPSDYLEGITNTGAQIVCTSRWLRALSVQAGEEQLELIRALPYVEAVTPVLKLQRDASLNAESFEENSSDTPTNKALIPPGDYGFSLRQAELARVHEIHRRGGSGRGVLIGVLDTGFQLDHRAFAGLDLIAQYDFINHDPDPSFDSRTDVKGQANHGTACLSVIGGYDPGSLVGIAPKASFALGKTEDTRSETAVEEDYWIEAIEWLEWLGADVVSSSLTYRDWYEIDQMDGRSPISRAAQRAAELGMVMCISAGNAGPGAITIGAPADAPEILAVAAVDSSGRLTRFSSRGPSSDGRIKPDVAAMGRQVVCVKPMSFDEYTRWNGTSLACPIVAGIAALVIEAHPDWTGKMVVEALRTSASQSYMPDYDYGYGLIDAVEAVDYPSLTIFLGDRLTRGQLWIGLLKQGELFQAQSMEGRYMRFVNLPPGGYALRIAGSKTDLNIAQTGKKARSFTLPPSGSLFLDDSDLP